MTLRTEIMSIENEIASVLNGVTFYRQNMPSTHIANEVTIESISSDLKTETAFHSTRSRSFRICYFGTSEIETMTIMEKLESLFLDRIKIAISDSQYLSVVDFSFSQGFETDSDGIFCAIGILRATTNEARKQPEYSKVMNVHMEKN